ncbi:phage protease [Williamsia herbipolensis]|uniref:Phage protease n=1 Tax=Williamsia herbipolensis TaxID=1603258 RepID=A0AAU4JY82_9NOCA|nr:phage protease [Williamsia herbipolensis]
MPLTLTDDQSAQLLDLIGLPADTTDVDTILATVTDLVAAEQGATDGQNDQKPSTVAAAARRIGLETVDTDTLASLRSQAAEAGTLKAAAARRGVEQSVDSAIKAGKIPPSRRDHWVGLVTADAELGKVLASMPDNVVPLVEIGHGLNSNGTQPDEQDDAGWFR